MAKESTILHLNAEYMELPDNDKLQWLSCLQKFINDQVDEIEQRIKVQHENKVDIQPDGDS